MKAYLKSAAALLAGFVTIFILSILTDIALEKAGYMDVQTFKDNAGWVVGLVLVSRIVYFTAGSFFTARLAPSAPLGLAMILGLVGLALNIVGAVMTWNSAPHWFSFALVVLGLLSCWVGGKLGSERCYHGPGIVQLGKPVAWRVKDRFKRLGKFPATSRRAGSGVDLHVAILVPRGSLRPRTWPAPQEYSPDPSSLVLVIGRRTARGEVDSGRGFSGLIGPQPDVNQLARPDHSQSEGQKIDSATSQTDNAGGAHDLDRPTIICPALKHERCPRATHRSRYFKGRQRGRSKKGEGG